MKTPLQAALVLEGGALRSLYTAGVLDVFIERGIEFSYVIGTSAGSLCGLNYLSKQAKRTMTINLNYCDDKDYIGVRNMFRHGGIINLDFLFEEPKNRWPEFDEETFRKSDSRFVIVVTSCETGKAIYFENPSKEERDACLKASSSMPLVSKRVMTTKGACLDGGVADSIPFEKAIADGNKKIVVVRTRNHAYRKKISTSVEKRMYHTAYRKEKEFAKAATERPRVYNEQVEGLYKLAAKGEAFIIEPKKAVAVGRIEKDREKLRALYIQGRQDAFAMMDDMLKYLEN